MFSSEDMESLEEPAVESGSEVEEHFLKLERALTAQEFPEETCVRWNLSISVKPLLAALASCAEALY